MARHAVIAGHICVDLFPALGRVPLILPGDLSEVGALAVHLGGCVANTGRVASKLGIPVALQGGVGDDWLGRAALELAREIPAAAHHIRPLPGEATSYSIIIEPPGRDRTIWHHAGANTRFDPATVDLTDARLLHVGYPPLMPACTHDDGAHLHRLFTRALDAGITTSLDLAVTEGTGVAWPAWLARLGPVTSVISPSRDDLASLLGDATASPADLAERLINDGFALAMVTNGAQGLCFAAADGARLRRAGDLLASLADQWAGARLSVPAREVVDLVTTLGAGDAATAGLLAALWRGLGPSQAGEMVAAVAACHLGGTALEL
ncbi:MAG: carbohydrate kinase family protein [Micrococcales bacterium]|nr:carbohydrate kinase family protein [Micrococcales bacterium]